MGVIMGANVKREADQIDLDGNIIDPKTKTVLKKNESDYIPTKEELAAIGNKNKVFTKEEIREDLKNPPQTLPHTGSLERLSEARVPSDDLVTLKGQIEEAELWLKTLKAKMKTKVAEMKKLLAEYE